MLELSYESYLSLFYESLENLQKERSQEPLWEPMKYPIEAGGKRLRPVLVYLFSNCFIPFEYCKYAKWQSLALEWVHTYSLVHDDLPCMDNDDYRRGKLTSHKVYGEPQALLIGDALLTDAFYLLSRIPEDYQNISCSYSLFASAVRLLSQAAGYQGMILGQWFDIDLSKNYDEKKLYEIALNKTGRMLGASLSLGASLAFELGFLENKEKEAQELGEMCGIWFQFQDDILDVTSQNHILGKTIGKDKAQNKLTAVTLWGLEEAQKRAWELEKSIIERSLSFFALKPSHPTSSQAREIFQNLIKDLGHRKF